MTREEKAAFDKYLANALRSFKGKQVRVTIEEIGEPRHITSKVVKVPR